MKHATNVLLDGLVFPEGPRWHGGRLWVSDIYAHRVLTIDTAGLGSVVAEVDQPSGLGFLPDGSLLVACMRDRVVRRVREGEIEDYADLRSYPGDYINDMVVDAGGDAYVGLRNHAGVTGADSLVVVRPDRTHGIAATALTAPNGAVLTPDGCHLVVAETHAFRLTMFDRAPDGTLSDRRTFATLPPTAIDGSRPPYPDGICLDADFAIWIGTAISGQYLRVREGGEILDRITPQAPWAVACVLGGDGRRTLFAATCATTLPGLSRLGEAPRPSGERETARYLDWARTQARGRIETMTVGTGGVGTP